LRPGDLITPTPSNPLLQVTAQITDALVADGFPAQSVRVLVSERATWHDAETLDCIRLETYFEPATIDGYELIVAARDQIYVYHTDTQGTIRRCLSAPLVEVPGDILIRFDAIAAELQLAARQQLADQLGISERRVRLEAMQVVIWPDTSLGCPQDDQTYTEIQLPGYRMVLAVEDDTYQYHTDTDRIIQCDADAVVLP